MPGFWSMGDPGGRRTSEEGSLVLVFSCRREATFTEYSKSDHTPPFSSSDSTLDIFFKDESGLGRRTTPDSKGRPRVVLSSRQPECSVLETKSSREINTSSPLLNHLACQVLVSEMLRWKSSDLWGGGGDGCPLVPERTLPRAGRKACLPSALHVPPAYSITLHRVNLSGKER